MKNGKDFLLEEIKCELLESIGGGGPNDPYPYNQGPVSATGNVNPNGNYSYNVGVTFTVNPNSTPTVTIGASVGGNNNDPVQNASITGNILF